MNNKDKKYLQFPLCVMQTFFNDPAGTIQKIFDAGIYRFSQRLPVDMLNVYRQLLYDYYRHKDKLTTYLENELTSHYNSGALELDEDYNGFDGADFLPNEIDQLRVILENDPEFKQAAIEYSQVHAALNILGIEGNTGCKVTAGKKLLSNIPDKEPPAMISKDLLFQYYKEDKNPWQLAELAAYIGIGSILGKKSYCRTNKEMILSRMFGYASHKHIPEKLNLLVSDLMEKYSTRYWMGKLLQELQLGWGIKIYSHNIRGLYIGNSKITMEALVLAAETKKRKNQIAGLKMQKDAAREKALQQLNKEQQLK